MGDTEVTIQNLRKKVQALNSNEYKVKGMA